MAIFVVLRRRLVGARDRSVCLQSDFPGVDRTRQPDSLPSALYLLAAATPLNLVGVKKVKQVRAPEKAIEQGREIPKALKGKS